MTVAGRFLLGTAVVALGLQGCASSSDKASNRETDSQSVPVVAASPDSAADFSRPIAVDSGVVSTADASAVIAALKSCSTDSNATGEWTGTIRDFARYSLFIPDSARPINSSGTPGILQLSWPRCEYCRFSVSVYGDSGISVDARIARMIAEQRRIDSINREPSREANEFDLLNGPPQPIQAAATGYRLDVSCGDCAAMTFTYGHAGYIADVSVSADAMPGAAQRICEMTAVAKSFSWRQ